MPANPDRQHETSELMDINLKFYNNLWSDAMLVEPERFNTWPLVSSLLRHAQTRLEVAPGLRPRLPLQGTQFVDISTAALQKLKARGAQTSVASIHDLAFPDASFDLLCALDILEHVDDDDGALAELSRVARAGATLLLSTPLHADWWTPFDDFVGHRRRYEPAQLLALLEKHGFTITHSAGFGMKPRSSRLTSIGMWFLQHRRKKAMWWYNRIMPFTVRFQKPLQLSEGLIPTDAVADVLLLCKRNG